MALSLHRSLLYSVFLLAPLIEITLKIRTSFIRNNHLPIQAEQTATHLGEKYTKIFFWLLRKFYRSSQHVQYFE